MSDSSGALTFPLVATRDGQIAGDPALGYLGEFLRVSLNQRCNGMWNSPGVCPGRDTVANVFQHDPKKLFDELRLPALYLWRGKSTHERIADELFKRSSDIYLAWIFEGAAEAHLVKRSPFLNAVAAAMQLALIVDRHPLWLVDGDTDPKAATHGSSITGYCGWSRLQAAEDEPQEFIFQRIEPSVPLPYYGFQMRATADEYPAPDLVSPATQAKLDAAQAANAPLTVATIPTAAEAVQIHWDVP